jgi:hypothetical protein
LREFERFVPDVADWKALLEFFPAKNIPELASGSAYYHFGSVWTTRRKHR